MASESTLSEYIQSQEELVREAALALPHQFSKCTYSLGPLRYIFSMSYNNEPHTFSETDKRFTFALHARRPVVSALLVRSRAIQIMNRWNCELWFFSENVAFTLISFRFPKRNFRCDCATEAIAHPCSLNPKVELENTSNQYSQNFKAIFCRCGRSYDAKTEKETMIQCLSCEVSSQYSMTAMHAPKSKTYRTGFMNHAVI